MNFRKPWAAFQKHIFWLIILCLPLFFINIRDNHDWGGDFAQYIAQAENIAKGIPHWKTNYVFNPDAAVYGPAAYPPGFPLLISPVIKTFGIDFRALMIWQTFFLLLFGLASFYLFRRETGGLAALLLALLIVYHPWLLRFKSEIMSGIAFSFLFIFTTLLYLNRKNNKYYHIIYLAPLIAFLPFVRTIGLVYLVALLLLAIRYLYLVYLKKKNHYLSDNKFHLSLLAASLLFYSFIRYILFPTPFGDPESYALLFNLNDLQHTLFSNISYYLEVLIQHFSLTSGQWAFVVVLVYSFFIVFFVLGLILKSIRDFAFTELLFLLYMGVLIVYPYRGSGFRFLLPVFPFMLMYAVHGAKFIKSGTKFHKDQVISGIGIFILLLYLSGIRTIVRQQNTVVEGPQKPASQELFNYIRKHTPAGASIASIKPRVIALFAERKSMGTFRDDSQEELEEQFNKFGVDYLLWFRLAGDENFEAYIERNPAKLEKVFENRNFKLYKRD